MTNRLNWTPPAGMTKPVASAWAQFYRHALDEYGITPQQYRDIYVAQYGCCYICRKAKGKHPDDPRGTGGRRLAVDHNHVTGRIRGLLCSGSLSADTCNRLIARYTPEALERAITYVRDEPAQLVIAKGEDLERAQRVDQKERDEYMRTVLGLS